MVVWLYNVGIEVILDVVYNYIVEGNELGFMLFFKGIDNVSYYCLVDDCCYYINDIGIGNMFDLINVGVLCMVMDLLCYWVIEMWVDGFCFDLVIIFGCEWYGFDVLGSFFDVVC